MKKRTVALLLALVLVFGAAIGGTIAYLTAETGPVTNTFTVGNINIDLDESDDLDLKMVPGNDITKDPEVTVKANSEACWLFVKIEKSPNLDKFISYTVDSEYWTALGDAYPGVYYYNGTDLDNVLTADKTYSVLEDNQVTVNSDVTKADMDALNVEGATQPTLTFTAYACQKANFATAALAWAEVGE